MATLKETAKTYESPQTKNIADLDVVPVDLELKEEKEVEYPYSYVMVDGERYRVPASVLKTLKEILSEKPEIKHIKVKKSGEGMKTAYTVIPLG